MVQIPKKIILPVMTLAILVSFSANFASAETVPEWVKNNALWYGQGTITESEFLNAMKFLIEQGILVVEIEQESIIQDAMIAIPNGNSEMSAAGFYLPLNLEIPVGSTVTWVNDDSVPHNIQSMDLKGNVIQLFNSPPLETGDRFEFTFEDEGVYKYVCTFHPWRVGMVTVS
ncbi:plastocyanin/azurin family copper-binding protein [Nitrosopumilus sp.]|uniref:cupredoxin domain-containing protein n=1 Tax=Nitrosopumilus sp. TaxID=2024843 RepID=UPI00260CCD71|nr:plastocyanin/azurin family copper-binding protein [Nitrosopumilus sp.]